MKIKVTLIVAFVALSLLVSSSVYCQEEKNVEYTTSEAFVPPRDESAATPLHVGKSKQSTTVQDEILDQLVTLDTKNADLQDVLRLLGARTGVNLIMSPSQVKGKVTLKLEDKPLRVILDSLLRVNDLAYVVEYPGLIRIVSRKEVTRRRVEFETRVFKINWVQAEDIEKSISPFVDDESGTVTPDKLSNSLIVSAPPPVVEKVAEIIDEIDVPEKQVLLEARMVDMTEDVARELGISWGAASLDLLHQEIDISVLLPTNANALISHDTSLGDDYWWRLDLFEKMGLVETLTAPRLVTLNNVSASMSITKTHPYIETGLGEAGQPINEVEFEESGITITILPNITNNNYVRMKISQTHMIFRGKDPDALVPIIDTRTANTSIIVKDEQVAIIGGLNQLQRTDNSAVIPWVHRAPLIGWLFKNSVTDLSKLEMVLFIKPTILKNQALTMKQEIQYGLIDLNWDLPDYFYDETKIDKTPYRGERFFEQLEEAEEEE